MSILLIIFLLLSIGLQLYVIIVGFVASALELGLVAIGVYAYPAFNYVIAVTVLKYI